MSIPALLLFIFAPVLGLFFRVRVGAVLSALIVAASLSVGASALAQSVLVPSKEWGVSCETDEWDDSQSCKASINTQVEIVVFFSFGYRCDGTGKQSVYLFGTLPLYGFASASGKWESGESFTLQKFQVRWDKEPASEIMMLAEGDSTSSYTWWWGDRGPDWWGWEELEMTPTKFPNPIRLLQEKSQLRIRHDNDIEPVITIPLAGAREAIAEAKKGCGL